MNLYTTIDADYRRVARRRLPDTWQLPIITADEAVAAIRSHQEHPDRSDDLTRRLALLARTDQRAGVVLLYALAPLLRSRLGRSITEEYRNDAFSELAIVILDSDLDGCRLASRLVNRAHTRVYKAARRPVHSEVHESRLATPCDPRRLAAQAIDKSPDVADVVMSQLSVERLSAAILRAIDSGEISQRLWTALRDTRVASSLGCKTVPATATDRKLASRAALRMRAMASAILHAA